MLDIGLIVAWVDFIVAILIVFLTIITIKNLKVGKLLSIIGFFVAATGIIYAAHVAIDVFGLGEELYAMTAFFSSMMLGVVILVVYLTISLEEITK